MTDLIVIVQTTVSTFEEAEEIARIAVTDQLAACVQMTAVASIFRWEGEVKVESEIRVDLKTTESAVPQLMALIKAHHPYEVPELIVTKPEQVTKDYASWVAAEIETY